MTRSSFDKIAFIYDFVETYILKDYAGSIELISEYLPQQKGALIVDIGGGTGYFSKVLANAETNAVVVDPSINMLMKGRYCDISAVQADATLLGMKSNRFDLALIINVLHHVDAQSQRRMVAEVMRILKKDGVVFIIEVFFPHRFFNTLFARFESFLVGKTYHLSPENLKNLLDSAGFASVDLFLPKNHSWKYVVLGKK
jgi:ubiquinone/menaquinone biosynthesis C-methylase UbiE